MASRYEQLVKALRECASDDPDCIYNCPYYNHDVCADDLKSDAADAIEALQADLDQWKAAVKGQEDGIKVLQAEVERLQVDLDAAWALREVQE